MEQWQRDWIVTNAKDLYELTECKHLMLTDLKSEELLRQDDIDELDRVKNHVTDGVSVQKSKFYSKLMGKNCYESVIIILHKHGLTGAANLLRKGKDAHHNVNQVGQVVESKFRKGVPKEVQDFQKSESKVLLMSTSDLNLTKEKISGNLETSPVIAKNARHLMELIEEKEEDSNSVTWFIYTCREGDGTVPKSKWLKEVVSLTKPKSKVILLTKHHSGLETIHGLRMATDILCWTELKCEFQDQLLDKEVTIQSGEMQRKSVRNILEQGGADEELQDEMLLLNLMNDRMPVLFRTLPNPLSYYVERKIRCRFELKQELIFTSEKNDVFLFTGIREGELSPYLRGCGSSSDNSGRQLSQLTGNYIRLEDPKNDHFNKICGLAKNKGDKEKKVVSVHWLHHESGKFFWVKSGNGNMTRIQKATVENKLFSQDDFVSHLETHSDTYGNAPVVIADTPGMGKSTLLQSLGRQMLANWSESRIVLFVAITDLVDLLKTMKVSSESDIREDLFETALLQLTTKCGPELGKHILKGMLRSSSKTRTEIKVELMLDGYDEVSSEDLRLTNKLFALVLRSYHSTRIWVATRPHLLDDLENELHVIGFKILPFDDHDQVKFLTKFWNSKKVEEEGESSQLSNCFIHEDFSTFATHCLKTMKNIWLKDSSHEDICGVPLRCLLIAEVFQETCLHYVSRNNITDEPVLPLKITSIKELYEALIRKKLETYIQRYTPQLRPEMKRNIIRFHYFLALQHLFPKYAQVFKDDLTQDGFQREEILKVGIVESINQIESTATSFGHRTVAEFLVARFVAEELCEDEEFNFEEKSRWRQLLTFLVSIVVKREQKDISFTNYDLGNLLFEGVLTTMEFDWFHESDRFAFKKFEHQVLVYFLDSLLEGGSLDKSTRLGTVVAGRKCPVQACVYGDHLSLFEALRNGYEDIDKTTLLVAVTHASKRFLKYICDNYYVDLIGATYYKHIKVNFHFQGNHDKLESALKRIVYDHSYFTILDLAVECREFSIVEYLLNEQGFGELVQKFDLSDHDPLHALVLNSNKNPEWLIKEKIKVLESLVPLNRNLLKGRTASYTELEKQLLLWDRQDFRQIIRHRDNAWNRGGNNDWESEINGFCWTYCRPLIRHLTPLLQENIHVELIVAMLKLGGDPLQKDENDSNLLHSSTMLSGDDFHRVVTTLTEEQLRALVNAKTKDKGSSVLHKIAENLRQPKKETLEHLLKLGADFGAVDLKQRSCLHIAAAVGNLEATRLFLELGMHAIVNVKDSKGHAPLDHLLVEEVNTEHLEEIGKLFLDHGATLPIDKITLLTKFRYGVKGLPAIKFLLDANVSTRENDLKTLFNLCIGSGLCWFEMVEMLLENDADVGSVNGDRDTLLQILIRPWENSYTNRVKTLALLLLKDAHLGSPEKAQIAFLNAIRASDYLPYEDFKNAAASLVKAGAELRNESGDGIALLHECAKEGLFNGIKYLVENGVAVNEVYNEETALHVVVDTYRYKKIAPYLLAKEAHVNIPDENGLTALERLIKKNPVPKLEVLGLFLAKASTGLAPLKSSAASKILFEVVEYTHDLEEKDLLQIAQSKFLDKADVHASDERKFTLLHYAARRRYPSLVTFLVEKGADPNMRNMEGETPLHVAVDSLSFRKDPVHIVETLLELMKAKGVDLKAEDGKGNTILDLSLNEDNNHLTPVMKFILGTGQFDAEFSNDLFLLGKVESFSKVETLQELFTRFELVTKRTLEDVGRESTAPEKCSILHVAAKVGNFDLVEFLLDSKSFVVSSLPEKVSSRFSNLLHVCVRDSKGKLSQIYKRRNIILKLVHHNKALLNLVDAEGNTPILVDKIDIALLQVLVELGADFNVVDGNGNTVAQVAEKYLNGLYYKFTNILADRGYYSQCGSTEKLDMPSPQSVNSFVHQSWKVALALPLVLMLTVVAYKYKRG